MNRTSDPSWAKQIHSPWITIHVASLWQCASSVVTCVCVCVWQWGDKRQERWDTYICTYDSWTLANHSISHEVFFRYQTVFTTNTINHRIKYHFINRSVPFYFYIQLVKMNFGPSICWGIWLILSGLYLWRLWRYDHQTYTFIKVEYHVITKSMSVFNVWGVVMGCIVLYVVCSSLILSTFTG